MHHPIDRIADTTTLNAELLSKVIVCVLCVSVSCVFCLFICLFCLFVVVLRRSQLQIEYVFTGYSLFPFTCV